MANKLFSEQKFINSKFQISKNFMYYMILPLVILFVGIILLFTVGFNLGTDFTGGSTFKVYVNNTDDSTFSQDIKKYDLDKKQDYSIVYNKIRAVLNKNGLKIVSYRVSSINIDDYKVFDGQAVEVVYQNKASGKNIANENESIREQLISAFHYNDYDQAISSVDQTMPKESFNFFMGILAAIVVSLALMIIYLLFRKMRGATVMLIIQVALDLLLSLGLILICRPVVNLSIGIVALIAFVLTVINAFFFLDRIRNGNKTGKYEKMSNNDVADLTTKETFIKRSLIYAVLLIISIVFIAVSTSAIRQLAVSIMLVLITSYYTSNFIMPAIWATMYHPKKAVKNKTKAN